MKDLQERKVMKNDDEEKNNVYTCDKENARPLGCEDTFIIPEIIQQTATGFKPQTAH